MFELLEIWRNSRLDKAELLRRIRVFTLDDAKIGSVTDRLHYAEYWGEQHEAIKKPLTLDPSKIQLLGVRDLKEYHLTRDLAANVSEILALLADIVQPRSFEDLIAYGFGEPP